MSKIGFPLYHGTSTLFLDGIAQHGLGGYDPVASLRVVECARKLWSHAVDNADRSDVLASRLPSFELMVGQVRGRMNFQHGQAYLTPARQTALSYACHKAKGSEIITYTLEVAEELLRLGVGEVSEGISNEYAPLFNLIYVNAAPVLLELGSVDSEALVSEDGGSADANLDLIAKLRSQDPDGYQSLSQQVNFRLMRPVGLADIRASLILTDRYQVVVSDYKLLEIKLPV
jgi:hypothetical protein